MLCRSRPITASTVVVVGTASSAYGGARYHKHLHMIIHILHAVNDTYLLTPSIYLSAESVSGTAVVQLIVLAHPRIFWSGMMVVLLSLRGGYIHIYIYPASVGRPRWCTWFVDWVSILETLTLWQLLLYLFVSHDLDYTVYQSR